MLESDNDAARTPKSYRNGGAAIVESLRANGTELIFGIPGTHNLELYRHLEANGIRWVTPRHEQGAGYAADGYHQVSGKPGVVITTSGPALFNVAAAAATAYAESRALLILSPGLPRGTVGGDAGQLHETKDSSGAFDKIVAWSCRVESATEAAAAVTEAFAFFAAGRPRPVHIEIPLDVLEEPWEGEAVAAPLLSPISADPAAIARAAALLSDAKRPIIMAGGGSRNASEALRELAERIGAPVTTTCNGKGVLPEDHSLSLGTSVRIPQVHAYVDDSDAVLVVGSELGDSDLWEWVPPSTALIRLDIDPGQLDKNVKAAVGLHADAATGLRQLLAALPDRAMGDDPNAVSSVGIANVVTELRRAADDQAAQDGSAWVAINRALTQALPAGSTVAGDSSQVTYLGTAHFYPASAPGQFLYMSGFATLGYGLPAAIGAKLADPSRAVAVLLGDGALMFSIQELVTAVELKLPIVVVVMDNSGYREIRDQEAARGMPPIGVDLFVPDLPALARACGANGFDAVDADHVGELIEAALISDRPTLIRLAC